MFKNFQDVEQYFLSSGVKKTIALAASNDVDALTSLVTARKKGFIDAVLIGDSEKTREILKKLGEPPEAYKFIEEPNEAAAAKTACLMVKEHEADIPMKGHLVTSDFMRAILDKTMGFVPEKGLLSQATLLEYTKENRFVIISDCAINIAPDYGEKMKIIMNAVTLAHSVGIEEPKVAVVAPVEKVNPAIQATIDAAMLSKAAQRGQIGGCIVDGPLALDNAIDIGAAKSKGIVSDVAGRADILIMPDLGAGNIFTKSLYYFANLSSAGTVCGARIPVVMTSRTDSAEDKYYSILTAVLQSL